MQHAMQHWQSGGPVLISQAGEKKHAILSGGKSTNHKVPHITVSLFQDLLFS